METLLFISIVFYVPNIVMLMSIFKAECHERKKEGTPVPSAYKRMLKVVALMPVMNALAISLIIVVFVVYGVIDLVKHCIECFKW